MRHPFKPERSRAETGRLLNGAKAWITNTHVGKVFMVMAVTAPGIGAKGISAFIVTPDTPGFSFMPHERKWACGRPSLRGLLSRTAPFPPKISSDRKAWA